MKQFITTTFFIGLILLSSCKPAEMLKDDCSTADPMCVLIFGEKDAEQDKALENLNAQVKILFSLMDGIVNNINTSSTLIQALTNDVNGLLSNNTVSVLQSQLATQQSQVTAIQSQLVTLAAQDTVVQYIDPCGDYPGHFDEIIMKTSTGKYIVFFEHHGKRFLTILTSGNYRTTDKQNCLFTVTSSGGVTW